MPHVIIEYSANLEQHVDISDLVSVVHEACVATGVFPRGGLRTRAERRDAYRVSDGRPENAFVHVDMLIAPGREMAAKKHAGEAIFAALTAALAGAYDRIPLAISYGMREIDNDLFWRKSNLREHMKAQDAA